MTQAQRQINSNILTTSKHGPFVLKLNEYLKIILKHLLSCVVNELSYDTDTMPSVKTKFWFYRLSLER